MKMSPNGAPILPAIREAVPMSRTGGEYIVSKNAL
jgi:hypothetical protein